MRNLAIHPSWSFHARALRSAVCACTLAFWASASWGQFGAVLNIPPDPDIGDNGGIGSSAQINLFGGGMIGESFEVGNPDGTSENAELNVIGGVVGNEPHANSGGTVNVSGGIVGSQMRANSGSELNISGGRVGAELVAEGALVNISGGELGNDFHVLSETEVFITGGSVGYFMQGGSSDGSNTNVSIDITGGTIFPGIEYFGGTLVRMYGGFVPGLSSYGIDHYAGSTGFYYGGIWDNDFDTHEESDVNVFGSEFYLDEEPIAATGGKFNIPNGSILSGVLSDGTPFALGEGLDDTIETNTLSLHSMEAPPIIADVINVPPDDDPRGIRGGQTLNVFDGGVIAEQFRAGRGGIVNIHGGQVGSRSTAIGAVVNVTGEASAAIFGRSLAAS